MTISIKNLAVEGRVTMRSSPQSPVANFTATPLSGGAPLSVTFTDTSTNTPTSWAWDFQNNGSTDSTLQNPTFNYSTAGTYSVKLTATNSAGSNVITKTNYITANTVDPSFSNVSFLIHAEGANNSTSFVDSSANNFTVGANNTAIISTSQKRYGNSSLYVNGGQDRIFAPPSTTDLKFDLIGTSQFTLETSVFITADSQRNGPTTATGNRNAALASSNLPLDAGPINAWWWLINGNTTTTGTGMQYAVWNSASTQVSIRWDFPSTLNKNQWYDLAICRNGTNWYAFLNGTLLGAPTTNTIGGTLYTPTPGNMKIGSTPWSNAVGTYTQGLFGFIDEFRMTKNVTRYTTSYTPTGPFPNE